MQDLIIQLLKQGKTQPEIAIELNKSLSSIEKYLKAIRDKYKAKTMFHLGFILGKI